MNCYNQSPNSTYTTPSSNQYISATPWGGRTAVDPYQPSSPLSIQPGRNQETASLSCPLTPEPPTTLPGVIDPEIPTTIPGVVNPVPPTTLPGVLPSPLPETITQPIYTPGYLRQFIGRLMRVEFLIGNQTTDRVGYLQEVGASFIVLQSVDSTNLILCDLYAIRFVTILQATTDPRIAYLYEE